MRRSSEADLLGFERLIEPVDLAAFLAEIWEQTPHVSRGEADRFESVLGLDEIDAVVAAAIDDGDGRGVVAVRSEGDRTEEHVVVDPVTGRRSTAAIHQAFDLGYTIVASHLSSTHPAISLLCASAESALQHPVGCNLYLTPPGARGFQAHPDGHDTFFLQVDGSKHWSLWEPAVELPGVPEPPDRPDRDPDLEVTLTRGDVLYLPRGWIHEGAAGDDLSLHITLGVRSTTWADLLIEWVTHTARRDGRLRRALPLSAHGAADSAIADAARDLLRDLDPDLDARLDVDASRGRTVFHDALDAIRLARLQKRQPPIATTFRSRSTPVVASVCCIVERRPGLDPVVTVGHDSCRITFAGGHLDGPRAAEASFRFVAEHVRFVVGDLPELPPSVQIDLTHQLVVQGLLLPAAKPVAEVAR